MEDGCTTLEERTERSKAKHWKGFDDVTKINYILISRPGWPDIKTDGGGDPDSVDYRREANEN